MIGLGGRSIGRRRVPLIVFTIYVDAVRHRNVRGRAAGAALQRLNVQAERLQSLDHERPRRQLVADQRVVVLRPAAARDGQTLRLDLRGASLGDIRRRAGLAEHLGTANIRDGVLILDLGPQRAAVPLQVLRRTGQLRFGPETGCCWSFSASSRPSNPNSGPFSSISHQKLQNYLSKLPMFGLIALELHCRRGPRKASLARRRGSPPGPSNLTSRLFHQQPIPPRATSWLISLIYYFPIKSSRNLGLRLHDWRAEELLRAVAAPETDATVGHEYLHYAVPP